MRFLFVIVAALFLTSCGGRHYESHALESSKINQSESAIVVFKVRGKSHLGLKPKVAFDLVKLDEKLGQSLHNPIFYRIDPGFFGKMNLWSDEWECICVKPGLYVIDDISWQAGNVTFVTRPDPFPNSYPVKYGAFQVKSGTVNYLGDLEVKCDQDSILQIQKMDRFDEAKEMIAKKYPDLASKLMRAEFIPGGTYYSPSHHLELNEQTMISSYPIEI